MQPIETLPRWSRSVRRRRAMLVATALCVISIGIPVAHAQNASPSAAWTNRDARGNGSRAGNHSKVTSQATGTVRGGIFDSLTMAPAANVQVWVSGTSQSTITDANGRFSLSGVAGGAHFIAFASPALDSLGLSALGTNTTVIPNQAIDVSLSTPAFGAIARALCGDTANLNGDAGIVWGTVRDATTGLRQAGARANFMWHDVSVGADKHVHSNEMTRAALTDSTATYYACGLPVDLTLVTHADGARASSGAIALVIGSRRVRRMDWLVSSDMVQEQVLSSRATFDSIHVFVPSGSSSLRGVVRSENAVPIPNTDVALASLARSVRTNASGEFALSRLPAGTHDLVVRRVGFEAVHVTVDLKSGNVETVSVVLPSTQLLEAVDVRVNKSSTVDRLDYEKRRKEGFGYAFDETAFKGHPDLATVLQGSVPSTMITRGKGGGVKITMRKISFSSAGGPMDCTPIVWEDGRRADLDALGYPLDHYRAIEIYARATSAPPMYVGLNQSCGVVLVWTKSARW